MPKFHISYTKTITYTTNEFEIEAPSQISAEAIADQLIDSFYAGEGEGPLAKHDLWDLDNEEVEVENVEELTEPDEPTNTTRYSSN
jgi:hypothetical protein|tara:strand:+ start:142 stop:399 length:258 start_codon:yes stop_codon:yes gene_type:complete